MVLAKFGLAKCGQIRMAKSGLAKCGSFWSAPASPLRLTFSWARGKGSKHKPTFYPLPPAPRLAHFNRSWSKVNKFSERSTRWHGLPRHLWASSPLIQSVLGSSACRPVETSTIMIKHMSSFGTLLKGICLGPAPSD